MHLGVDTARKLNLKLRRLQSIIKMIVRSGMQGLTVQCIAKVVNDLTYLVILLLGRLIVKIKMKS